MVHKLSLIIIFFFLSPTKKKEDKIELIFYTPVVELTRCLELLMLNSGLSCLGTTNSVVRL